MGVSNVQFIFLVTLSVIYFTRETDAQFFCLPGEINHPITGECVTILKGPGGRWRSGGYGGITNPLPFPGPLDMCLPGTIWVDWLHNCIPSKLGGPGGRWKSGRRSCPPGYYWDHRLLACVPNDYWSGGGDSGEDYTDGSTWSRF